jgi:hypothetical protein
VRDPARWREGRVGARTMAIWCFMVFLSIYPSFWGHFGAKMGVWELFLMLFEGMVSGSREWNF